MHRREAKRLRQSSVQPGSNDHPKPCMAHGLGATDTRSPTSCASQSWSSRYFLQLADPGGARDSSQGQRGAYITQQHDVSQLDEVLRMWEQQTGVVRVREYGGCPSLSVPGGMRERRAVCSFGGSLQDAVPLFSSCCRGCMIIRGRGRACELCVAACHTTRPCRHVLQKRRL